MSPSQVKTLLTRIGENSKFIISGDLDQSDRYRKVEDSGLYDALHRHRNLDEVGFYEFTPEDIVRNPIITKILNNYQREEKPISGNTRTIPKVRKMERIEMTDGVGRNKQVRNIKARWKRFKRRIKKFTNNG
jgi:hypothetical protein